MSSTILLGNGKYFDLLRPDPFVMDIETIGHALSNLCRFTGHTNNFYSVAQHSVLVSRLVHPEIALEGLLHDAAEAFVGDVASPLKKLLPEYRVIEARVEEAVVARFGLRNFYDPRIKHADLAALASEKLELMPSSDDDWGLGNSPGWVLHAQSPEKAFDQFMYRYYQLAIKP